jgi:hypothetical protein
MNLKSDLGESQTFRIPLRSGGRVFTPGAIYALTFTVKLFNTDADADAVIQKATSGLGVVVDGDDALVTILRADTYREADYPETGDPAFELAAGTYVWDIQADGLPDTTAAGDCKTVNSGTFIFARDITRGSGPTITIYTTEDPLVTTQGKSAYQSYLDTTADDPVLSEAQWAEAASFVGLRDTLTVLSAAERKNAATYTGANSASVGYTRVFQSDLPGILWTLIDTDVTLDASWIGQPYTVDPDGDVIVSMELADITGTVPDRNVLGVSGNQLRLGDGVTTNGVDVFNLPPDLGMNAFTLGMTSTEFRLSAKFTYTKTTAPTGTVNVGGGATHVKFLRWDGTYHTVRKAVSGNTNFVAADWGAAPLTPYNTRLPKYGAICPCDSAGNPIGYLTTLSLGSNQLTTFSGTGLSALTSLSLGSNQLTTFSSTGLSALTTLELYSNQLTTFSGTGLSALTLLYLQNNNLTTFSGTGLSALTSLNLTNNQLTTFSGTGLSALTYLELGSNQLTTFSGTGLSALTALFIENNQLTSILATGLNLSYAYGSSGSDIGDNDLSLEALQAFVDSLAVTTIGFIEYGGNPGSTDFAAWLNAGNDKDYIWDNS